jgi:hypothetical protein
VDFTHYLQLTSAINYTKARANVDGQEIPLDHIPPLYGKTSVIAKFKKFKGEIWAQYNGAKNSADYSPSGEDNKQYSADAINGKTRLEKHRDIHLALKEIMPKIHALQIILK